MRFFHSLILTCFVALAASCGGNGGGPDIDSTASVPATDTTNAPGVWFEPVALSSCDTRSRVKVRWNVTPADGTDTVNVFTVRPGGKEAVFAGHTKSSGSKRTGRWIRAGREFVVRDGRGAELARAAVGTLPCASNSPTP